MMDDLPRKHFGTILADPPWKFKTYNEKGRLKCPDWKPFKSSPALHYETMTSRQIMAMPIDDLAAPDCVLFLWASCPMLIEAMNVISAWGFKFKTMGFVWMKAHVEQIDMFRDDADALMGTGYWTRANAELCLLATRGRPKRRKSDVRMGIIEPRREHSRKPDCVHSRIERLVSGPYLELFARQQRKGWTTWGNETDKFQQAAE